MGLDSVELVMSVEDAFQINISEEEASKIRTVGEFYDVVRSKLAIKDDEGWGRCLTSTAFYRVRRAMVEVLRIDRRKITPKTELSVLLPTPQRRENWGRITRAASLKIPKLGYNSGVILLKFAILMAVGTALGLLQYLGIVGLTIVSFIAALVMAKFTPALLISLPASTVGALAEQIYLANVKQLSEGNGGLNEREVWDALTKIIIQQLGVKPEEVTPEARFIEDLRIS